MAEFFDTFCVLVVAAWNAAHVSTCRADEFPEICCVFLLFRLVDVSWEGKSYARDALLICIF